MANKQYELVVETIFAEEGKTAQDIIDMAFRVYINRDLGKSAVF